MCTKSYMDISKLNTDKFISDENTEIYDKQLENIQSYNDKRIGFR